MLTRSIEAMLASPAVDLVVPVIHGDHDERYAALKLSDARLAPPVIGGASRQASVLAGLTSLGPLRPDLVLIQDAARPFAADHRGRDRGAAWKATTAPCPWCR
jgi:2-C-methyl-D-erythritol 4-phosphate cytidylyltransferase/2-C-methyl-D-erythritol 2,4-cyclodiphosphate synthase